MKHYRLLSRPQITIGTTFPVFPPDNFYQHRVFQFCKSLAYKFDIDIISLTQTSHSSSRQKIAPGVQEIQIYQQGLSKETEDSIINPPDFDTAFSDYLEALKQSTNRVDFLVICHPQLFSIFNQVSQKPICYDAGSFSLFVENQERSSLLSNQNLEALKKAERECCNASRLILTCSQNETQKLKEEYHIEDNKIVTIPNSIDVSNIPYTSLDMRQSRKRELGFKESKIAIFIGKDNPTDIDAARSIFKMAALLPQIQFLILGSVCHHFNPHLNPPNLALIEVVDQKTKNLVLSLADMALHPVSLGTEYNLRLLEYIAAGIPTISTQLGTVGLDFNGIEYCVVADLWQFPNLISQVISQLNPHQYENQIKEISSGLRALVKWETLLNKIDSQLSSNFM